MCCCKKLKKESNLLSSNTNSTNVITPNAPAGNKSEITNKMQQENVLEDELHKLKGNKRAIGSSKILSVQRTQNDGSIMGKQKEKVKSKMQKINQMEREKQKKDEEKVMISVPEIPGQSVAEVKRLSQEPLSIQPERKYARRKIKSEKVDARDPLYATITSSDSNPSTFELAEIQSAKTYIKVKSCYEQRDSENQKMASNRVNDIHHVNWKEELKSSAGKVENAEGTQKDDVKIASAEGTQKDDVKIASAEGTQKGDI
uniref:Uncharacterized protein n=1 Tax=Setaria digitata TaxID=48799 RepID=A0A915Q2R7_9BILA